MSIASFKGAIAQVYSKFNYGVSERIVTLRMCKYAMSY